jgi:hypothetical protein
MSASDISREAFVGITTLACGGYLKALRTRRLVHVSGWRKTCKGFVTPLFSLGDRPDLPGSEFKDEDRDSAGMNLIVDALEWGGMMTYREAAKASGLSSNAIKNTRYIAGAVKRNAPSGTTAVLLLNYQDPGYLCRQIKSGQCFSPLEDQYPPHIDGVFSLI